MIALLGRLLGFVAGSLLRIRRRLVEDAMRRAGISDPARHARAMYASLGRGIIELLWLGIASRARREAFLASVVLDDTPAGHCVLAASHTGNWEVAAAAAARTRRVAIVAKPFTWRAFDAFCTYLRRRLGVEVIRPDGALTAARSVLAGGGSVAMPIDQVPDREAHGVRADFLGGPVLVDRAPFVLAKRARVPVLVIAASRDRRVHVLARIDVHDVTEAARDATAALEAFVRRDPASWMWLHRRWRAPRTSRIVRSVARHVVAALMLVALVGCRSAAQPRGDVPYVENDFERALDEGRRTHRPVVVDVWASWCMPCRDMAKTMADPTITQLRDHFVWASLDADEDTTTAARARLRVSGMPTLAVVEPDGAHIVFRTHYAAPARAMRRALLAAEEATHGTDWDKAAVARRFAAALERDLPNPILERAELAGYLVPAWLASAQAEHAIPFCEQIVAAFPYPTAMYGLGAVYLEAGRPDDARAMVERLTRLRGEYPMFNAYMLRADIEEKTGNLDATIAVLEEAVATTRRLGYEDSAKTFERILRDRRTGRLVGGAHAE